MFFKKIHQNWQSGLTVALVSIPLAISLVVASGASPVVGIITALWAGLVASIFGGSNYNIIGPTGALSGIIATYAFMHGVDSLAMLTIVTGVFILLAYVFKFEHYLIFIPSSVVHGFTLGVAFIIGLNQLNYAFGLQNIPVHEHLFENVLESCRHLSQISWGAIIIFCGFLVGLFLMRRLTQKIPGAIVLTPLGILLGYVCKLGVCPWCVQTLGDKFGAISFKAFMLPHFVWQPNVLQTAAVLALVAILETMLSAKIADNMTHTKHNPRKEMLGLGLANLASGIMGGIPATAALARTSLNVKTRATDKMSATLSSIFIALISIFLLTFFSYIPLAVIAAILVFVSIQMVEAEHFIPFFKYERTNFWVSMLVAFVTVYADPIIGILVGALIALLLLVDKISRGQCEMSIKRFSAGAAQDGAGEKVRTIQKDVTMLVYSMKGKLCYINSRAHLDRLQADFGKYTYIVLRLREIYFIDLDGVGVLDEVIKMAQERGQKIMISGVAPYVVGLLEQASEGYRELKRAGHVFDKAQDAVNFVQAQAKV